MNDDKLTKVPHFDGHYDHWSEVMKNLFKAKGLWGIVEIGYVAPLEGTLLSDNQQALLDNAKIQDHQVKHYLFQALDRHVFEQILDRITSKVVWESLKKKYGGNDKVKKALRNKLMRDFELLEMKKNEIVDDYFRRVTTVCNKLRSNGEEMKESKIVAKILRTLSDKFTYIVVSIEESQDIEELTVDALQGTLALHEQKFNRGNKEKNDQVLQVEDGYAARSSKGRGNYKARGRGIGRLLPFNKASVECYKCHAMGHFQNECPRWEKETHYASIDEEDDLLLMAEIEEESNKQGVWYIDYGCSNHMCRDKKLFVTMDKTFNHTVKLGNNSRMEVVGKGNVKIKVGGENYTISNVYCVSELKSNLFSVGQFQDKGLSVVFKDGICCIYHQLKGEIIRSKMGSNRMFTVRTEVRGKDEEQGECLQAVRSEISMFLHQRYGHLSFKGLKTLQNKGMVRGLPNFKAQEVTCPDCISRKLTRKAIPKTSTWRAEKVLELIHSDICGPIQPTSNSGKKYFLSFIDDFSRKGWIYLLINKSEAWSHFKFFKSMVEKETEELIKCLRTLGEFTSTDFNEYCDEHGIKRQFTTSYTPQQNGVAERRNRTIMNMVRSLLSAKKMSKSMWPEPVLWTVYVLNRCPTLTVKDKTPHEAWCGLKPSVEHLKVWGCVAHVHVPKQNRSKLDNRSKICVFFGINEGTKGYRLVDLETKRIIINRNVIFEEDKAWDWGNDYIDQVNAELEWKDELLDEPVECHVLGENEVEGNNEGHQPIDHSSDTSNHEDQTSSGEENANQGRVHRAPRWMEDYVSGDGLTEEEVNMVLDPHEDPVSFDEAVLEEKWKQAMDIEMKSIVKNNTWTLTKLPHNCKRIGVKWIFKIKEG
ncbi:hypothetical protein LIER_24938 [Lithospermum erythrorhizon]|uniref:Uncharacterized protein n=1 Tax=Lithospermum erythrorhizon TaxID=34254 RepID=A0AAV3R326_LITER